MEEKNGYVLLIFSDTCYNTEINKAKIPSESLLDSHASNKIHE